MSDTSKLIQELIDLSKDAGCYNPTYVADIAKRAAEVLSEKSRTIILVCGRSGSGKDTYVNALLKRGYKSVCSYTTRPRRDGEGNTHIFINNDEVDLYPDKVAITEINGYTYFATKEQLMEADFYIIDPLGIKYLTENFPEIKYRIVYIYADKNIRKHRAVMRGGEKEANIFEARDASENEQFTEFEQNLYKTNAIVHVNNGDNIDDIIRMAKDDTEGIFK